MKHMVLLVALSVTGCVIEDDTGDDVGEDCAQVTGREEVRGGIEQPPEIRVELMANVVLFVAPVLLAGVALSPAWLSFAARASRARRSFWTR